MEISLKAEKRARSITRGFNPPNESHERLAHSSKIPYDLWA